MGTPPSTNSVPAPPDSVKSWSDSLKRQTLEALEQGRVSPATLKLHLKNINGGFGHITVQDLLDWRLNVHSETSGECWLAENAEELLDAGWAID